MDVTVKRNRGLNKGFTLIEILVVIGIIAILAAVVLIAINPARQFAQARNSQRVSNDQAILNAIGQNMADNKGLFTCATLPTTATEMRKASGGYDIRPCIVPTYMSEIPYDPNATGALNTCNSDCSSGDYNTKYTVFQDSVTKRITVAAPSTELTTPTPCTTASVPACISITR